MDELRYKITFGEPDRVARCRKCGEEILSDEDSLCGYCAGEAPDEGELTSEELQEKADFIRDSLREEGK